MSIKRCACSLEVDPRATIPEIYPVVRCTETSARSIYNKDLINLVLWIENHFPGHQSLDSASLGYQSETDVINSFLPHLLSLQFTKLDPLIACTAFLLYSWLYFNYSIRLARRPLC